MRPHATATLQVPQMKKFLSIEIVFPKSKNCKEKQIRTFASSASVSVAHDFFQLTSPTKSPHTQAKTFKDTSLLYLKTQVGIINPSNGLLSPFHSPNFKDSKQRRSESESESEFCVLHDNFRTQKSVVFTKGVFPMVDTSFPTVTDLA